MDCLSISLQQALVKGLEQASDDDICKFLGVIKHLSVWKLLDDLAECYLSRLVTARMLCYIALATIDGLHWLSEEVLPCLPTTAAWADARASATGSLSHRMRLLLRTQAFDSPAPRSS